MNYYCQNENVNENSRNENYTEYAKTSKWNFKLNLCMHFLNYVFILTFFFLMVNFIIVDFYKFHKRPGWILPLRKFSAHIRTKFKYKFKRPVGHFIFNWGVHLKLSVGFHFEFGQLSNTSLRHILVHLQTWTLSHTVISPWVSCLFKLSCKQIKVFPQ